MEITESNLEAEVLVRSSEVPVVNCCGRRAARSASPWPTHSGALAAADKGTWSLATINVDAVPRLAAMFGVEAVPTVVALAGGQPIASFEGPQPPSQLRRWIDSLLAATAGKLSGPPGSPNRASIPCSPTPATNWTPVTSSAAAAAYQALLDADPKHMEAKGALRQITFLQRASAQPAGAVSTADAAPDDIDAAFAAADVQMLNHGHGRGVRPADRAWSKRTSRDDDAPGADPADRAVRVVRPADPDVIAGRRNLANALYYPGLAEQSKRIRRAVGGGGG